MKKIWEKGSAFQTGETDKSLVILAFCYAMGAVAGYVLCRFTAYSIPQEESPQWASFLSYFWRYAKYLLLAFVCGYTALGLLVQPALVAARGFTMSAAVVSTVTALPRIKAVNFFLETALISLTSLICLFFLSTKGLRGAGTIFSRLTHRRGGMVEPGFPVIHLLRFFICMFAVAAAGALNLLLVPYLRAMFFK